ncbi:MAG TPA: dTDP-4-dehydrorhamnose 3,5-epimerase [Polyangiaceae bacterium]|nr:MAG: dTDP-4-dehydrorhamnose 3,5-epimerase [Pseudomonadota bacterium]HLV67370.1 dTDP-4-dehydrorhamnose 3,5-epimerase [Polyangiaceae bacterium]
MEVVDLDLSGLKLIKPRVFRDSRGFFLETYQASRYGAAGIPETFVQDNHSRSVRGTLRGLHYQSHPGQAKLVRVVSGRIFDVTLDIRPESPTFGRWHGLYLDAEAHHQLYIPVGFAHGFCVTSEVADVLYKVSTPYDARTECTIAWNDPEIGVDWPVQEPVLSARDQNGESFRDFVRRIRG